TAKKLPAELEHAIVSVDENDDIKLDGRAISVDTLVGAVRDLPEGRKSTLALQADRKASFGAIIKVMDALKLAGVRNLPAFTREEKRSCRSCSMATRSYGRRANGSRRSTIGFANLL